ncbi:MAG: molybdopterin cofactor-binding domain-containing protein [Solirubrobacteraceae bacterium]
MCRSVGQRQGARGHGPDHPGPVAQDDVRPDRRRPARRRRRGRVEVTGDTDAFEWGVATFASRAAVVSGSAISRAAAAVREKAIAMAANMLEAAPEDLDIEHGRVFVRGSTSPT